MLDKARAELIACPIVAILKRLPIDIKLNRANWRGIFAAKFYGSSAKTIV